VLAAIVVVGLIGGAVALASQGSDNRSVARIQSPASSNPSLSTGPTPPTARTPTTKSDLSAIVPSRETVVIGPSPGETGPLDVAEAEHVTTLLWSAHVRARYRGDASLLKAIEAGPALEADYGYLCYIGCRSTNATESRQYVNVPHQTSWPVAFAANVQYVIGCTASQQPCVDTLVMRQEARNLPWKIVFWTTAAGAPNSPEQFPALSGDGKYALASGPPRISADDLLTDYANYLDTLKRTGNPPASTRLAPGAFTTGLASYLYEPLQHQVAVGSYARVSYRVNPADPTWTFATSQSTTLVCGTVRYVASFVGVDGRVMVQPPDFSGFGTDVLPGRYSSIVQRGLHMICFGLHSDVSEPAYVIGNYGDDTQVDTTTAH
jgi:hypothetical protein